MEADTPSITTTEHSFLILAMDRDPVGKESLASAGLGVVTGLLSRSRHAPIAEPTAVLLLPAAGFLGVGEISARVGLVPKRNLP